MVPNPIATEVVFFLENHYGLPWNENSNKSYSDSNPPTISTSTGWIFRCFSHVLPPALPMLRPAGASKASTHNVDKGFSRTTAASPACNSGGRMTKI